MKKEHRVFSWKCFFWGILVWTLCMTGCAGKTEDFFLMEENTSAEVTEVPQSESNDAIGNPDVQSENIVPTLPIPEETEIYVDVCGAVVSPGVYQLEAGSRVFQAIDAAGGLLPEAAQGYVNRAQSLNDGQQIYIPTKEEAEELQIAQGTLTEDSSSQATEEKVNINTADAETLMTLSGIGESKAQAIIAYRDAQGGFSSIEEIMNVQGIKESTFVKIKEDIIVG